MITKNNDIRTLQEILKNNFILTKEEVASLVKEFSHQYVKNHLASEVLERMIKFVK